MKTLIALLLTTLSAFAADPTAPTPVKDNPVPSILDKLSVETFGALRHIDLKGKPNWGAGVDVGLQFNRFVTARIRAISYSTDDWGGSAIDEGSALVEARLFGSNNGKLTLSAIGGGHRDFSAEDWGFGVGARAQLNLTKRLALFGQSELRAWFNQEKDVLTTAGLSLSF